jgi:hypothetical protein
VGLLASFVKFKIDFGAGSGSLPGAEGAQFVESRTAPTTNPVGYYSQHIFGMKPAGGVFTTRERGLFGIHWINLTSGELDTTWTSADYASVEGAIETMWSSLAAIISSDFRLEEHRWYAFGAGVTPPNPPSRITTLATPAVGTATATGVHQAACTVTLRTTLRRHWGRFYLPLAGSQVGSGGQITNSNTDAIAAAARTALLVTPAAQGVIPVVYDRTRKLVFGTTQLEVDSVPDIIRRRRPRDTSYRKIYTA